MVVVDVDPEMTAAEVGLAIRDLAHHPGVKKARVTIAERRAVKA